MNAVLRVVRISRYIPTKPCSILISISNLRTRTRAWHVCYRLENVLTLGEVIC